jgi:hypothetical protein
VDQLTYGPLCNILFMAYTAIVVNGEGGWCVRLCERGLRACWPLLCCCRST